MISLEKEDLMRLPAKPDRRGASSSRWTDG